MAVVPVDKGSCNPSFTVVVVVAMGFALEFVPVGAIGESGRVRIAVTVPTKSLTWMCTIASTVLGLAMFWVEPGQDPSAAALVSAASPSPGTEGCSPSVSEMAVAEAGSVVIGSVIVLVLDVAVEASGNA